MVGDLAQALFEDLQLGFRLTSTHTPRGCKVETSLSDVWETVAAAPIIPNPTAIEAVADLAAESFTSGVMLELTGGIDSRLILALALSRNSKPTSAFTIGESTSPDVRAAKLICDKFGIEHVVVPTDVNTHEVVADSYEFIRNSRYCSNACSYGWLPAVFRRLAPYRHAQVSGAGGEYAGGFYYTGQDWFFTHSGALSLWIRWRLRITGTQCCRLFFHSAYSERLKTLECRIVNHLQQASQPFRFATDEFYRCVRLRHWAAPVLRASSGWYRVITPLFSADYFSWARSLPMDRRFRRLGQLEMIASYAPDLAQLPYSNEFGGRSPTYVHKLARKISGQRAAPDLGSVRTAELLANDESTKNHIWSLVDACDDLDAAGIRAVLKQPGRFAHEVGCLITAAVAYHDSTQFVETGTSIGSD